MNDDLDAVCDEVWHGTNGDDLLVCSGCPGCHYVAGAAAYAGLIAMAEAIRTRPFDPFARMREAIWDLEPDERAF